MHVLIILLAMTSLTYATESHALRCGNLLITQGDTISKVRNSCGAPTLFETRQIEYMIKNSRLETSTTYVDEENWLYNRGRNQLIRLLRFENGKLATVSTGERGRKYQQNAKFCQYPVIDRDSIGTTLLTLHKCGTPSRMKAIEMRMEIIDQMPGYELFVSKKVVKWFYNDKESGISSILLFEHGKLIAVSSE